MSYHIILQEGVPILSFINSLVANGTYLFIVSQFVICHAPPYICTIKVPFTKRFSSCAYFMDVSLLQEKTTLKQPGFIRINVFRFCAIPKKKQFKNNQFLGYVCFCWILLLMLNKTYLVERKTLKKRN